MEIDLELPLCEQDRLDTRLDEDGNVVNAEDKINVGKMSENVKEAHEARIDKIVDDASSVEMSVIDKGFVSNVGAEDGKSSEHVRDAGGFSADRCASEFQGQGDVNNVVANVVDNRVGVVRELEIGLEFETKEDAYSYYRQYAWSVGFGITIVSSRRSKRTGKFIDIKVACSRYRKQEAGDREKQSGSLINTGCKAGLQMKKRENEKWYIHSFVKEHNHEMTDGFLPSGGRNNKKPATVACQKEGLQLALDEEDTKVLFEQLMCMQDENPNFFYAIDFDPQKQLRCVFWVDSKGRRDYSSFCDAVLFDTYYVRNKYKIPLVPIVGVNNHFQYILLGCALIGDETRETFVWLMQTWLKAVGGQAPRVVFTDHDKYLKEAVADVFTDACHRFCLWHVLSRINLNVCCSINEDPTFLAKLNKCIYWSWTIQQFEQRWWKLINRFELRENRCICLLYEDRKHWAPTYMQDFCSVGISTVERSGSITSFFDRYISQEATVKDFMEQYKAFLKDSYDIEASAGFEVQNNQPELRSMSPFEKQISTIYTDTIFRKFQVEVLGVESCHLQKDDQNEATAIFRVDDLEEQQKFIVAWNEPESRVCCLCHSFEYKGILCRHALLVLHMSGVSRIPSYYILKRWMKDARVGHNVSDGSKRLNYRVHRFNDLCKLAVKLGEQGSLSLESYQIACHALHKVQKQCVHINQSIRGVSEPNASSIHGPNDVEEVIYSGTMMKLSKKKKTHYKRKGEIEPEGIPVRFQDSCQKMELGSKVCAQDNGYGSRQSMQELGRLNSVSPNHEGSYGYQQATQEHSAGTSTFHGNISKHPLIKQFPQ